MTLPIKNMLNLSETLKFLMYKKDLKTSDLARFAKVPQSTVHRIVQGVSTRPHIANLQALANYFKISLEQLKGKEPLEIESSLLMPYAPLKSVPIYTKEDILAFLHNARMVQKGHGVLFANAALDEKSFALVLEDDALAPYFLKGSQLIINTHGKMPADNETILVYLKHSRELALRIFMHGSNRCYLRPIGTFSRREEFDLHAVEIIGVVYEERRFNPCWPAQYPVAKAAGYDDNAQKKRSHLHPEAA